MKSTLQQLVTESCTCVGMKGIPDRLNKEDATSKGAYTILATTAGLSALFTWFPINAPDWCACLLIRDLERTGLKEEMQGVL